MAWSSASCCCGWEPAFSWRDALAGQWPARLMLAIALWKKRDLSGMQQILEETLKGRGNRKQGLVWCAYAWLLEKEDRHEEAVRDTQIMSILGAGDWRSDFFSEFLPAFTA